MCILGFIIGVGVGVVVTIVAIVYIALFQARSEIAERMKEVEEFIQPPPEKRGL